jgi:hypothetical protein
VKTEKKKKRPLKYIHVSTPAFGLPGVTYNIGRNAEKRARRAAGLRPLNNKHERSKV